MRPRLSRRGDHADDLHQIAEREQRDVVRPIWRDTTKLSTWNQDTPSSSYLVSLIVAPLVSPFVRVSPWLVSVSLKVVASLTVSWKL